MLGPVVGLHICEAVRLGSGPWAVSGHLIIMGTAACQSQPSCLSHNWELGGAEGSARSTDLCFLYHITGNMRLN